MVEMDKIEKQELILRLIFVLKDFTGDLDYAEDDIVYGDPGWVFDKKLWEEEMKRREIDSDREFRDLTGIMIHRQFYRGDRRRHYRPLKILQR